MRLRICRNCFRVRGVYQMIGYLLLFLFMLLTLQFRDNVSDCTVFNLQGTLFYRPRPHFFCLKYSGNLGDQMFQYAFLLTLRIRYSTEITLPSNNILTPVFNIVPQNEFILQYCDCFQKRTQKETTYGFDPTLLNMDVNFEGSYKSYKYFESQVDEVRSRFYPKKWITSKVRKELDKIRHGHGGKNSTLVGIYLPHPAEGFKDTNVENFLQNAIQLYREQYRNVIFICVIKEGAETFWMKSKFILQKDISVLVESGEDIVLGLLAGVDHSVILKESLAWWGAWLAGGKVVYYQDNFDSNDSSQSDNIRYPPAWNALN
ncbi:galactoside 2-alpha-L-fucosyltransferase 1-like [Pecten maximus]|uniref:galactoside 2-alpha-L-fucosyltransferase 1-like n=1 Tax=Pecten maximus TaxID=6579 RepID=UPI0014582C16|nr:galactoside 2-alpha-L-fucosyltransferase 1-like [Pecten maximus]